MDIVLTESIKIPNAIVISVISGLTDTKPGKEMEKYLSDFGSVHRTFHIDTLDYPNHTIVDFTDGTAMEALTPMFPLNYTSPSEPKVIFEVVSLDSIYRPLACDSATKAYMAELQQIAELRGKSFDVLFV